jgi:hypothetical protein
MLRRLLILNIVGVVLNVIAWILIVAALAYGEWTLTTGSSTSISPFGAVSITQSSGIFRTYTTKCCLATGSPAPEAKISVCSGQCPQDIILSSKYCDFIADELQINTLGHNSINCSRVQGSSVAVIILIIIAVISIFVVMTLFLAKKVRVGVWGLGLIPAILCTLISLIVYRLGATDEIEQFFRDRFRNNMATGAPFITVLGDSYKLLVAGFVFQLLGIIIVAVRWAMRERKFAPEPVPAPAPREVVLEPTYMMTPEAAPRASPPKMAISNQEALPICPNDFNCTFVNNFGHQLEYAHTCRNYDCTDSSAAHQLHFLHGPQTRQLQILPPPRVAASSSRAWRQPTTAYVSANGNVNRSVSDPYADTTSGVDETPRRAPSWLQPTGPDPPPLGVQQQPSFRNSPRRSRF